MKKKIFITGISSSLMQKLVDQIDRSEYEIIGLTRNSRLQLPHLKLVVGDIHNLDPIAKEIMDCDIIIHAAAVTHSFRELAYYQTNLEATQQLVDLSKQGKPKSFVFISSFTAGGQSGAYGESKLLAENYMKIHLDDWVIFRPSEIFGGPKNEGIEALIRKALRKSILFCPTDVPTKLYPIHIEDVVQIMMNAIFDNYSKNQTVVINGAEGFSFQEVIELVASVAQKRIRIFFISKKIIFLISWIARKIPVYLGIIPDQIERLYSQKEPKTPPIEVMKLETYVKGLIGTKH